MMDFNELKSELLKMKGFFLRGSTIYVRGTSNKRQYKFSTQRELTMDNLLWCRKQNSKLLLEEWLYEQEQKEKIVTEKANNLEDFGLKIIEVLKTNWCEEIYKDSKSILFNYIINRLNDDMAKVKTIDIDIWQNELLKELSVDRVRDIKNLAKRIFQKAVVNGIISSNPFDGSEQLKEKNISAEEKAKIEMRSFFSEEEAKLLVNEAKGWFYVYLMLFFRTGMRNGEINGLRWENISFKDKCIYLRAGYTRGRYRESSKKKEHFRTIPLSDTMISLLLDYKENVSKSSIYLFVNRFNQPFYDSSNINKYHLYPLLEKLGIEKKPLKGIRKSFVTFMLDSNEVPLHTVQRMVGHQIGSRVTEQNYYRKGDKKIKSLEINMVNESLFPTSE